MESHLIFTLVRIEYDSLPTLIAFGTSWKCVIATNQIRKQFWIKMSRVFFSQHLQMPRNTVQMKVKKKKTVEKKR